MRTGRVCLGLDVQTTRIGIAAAELEGAKPVWAETFPLRGPGLSLGGHVRQAIRLAEVRLEGLEVGRVAIERPVVKVDASLDYIFDCGGVYHLALDACIRRFGRVALVPLRIGQWKKASVGNGNAAKGAVAIWARECASAAGWPDFRMAALASQDACDALGVAVAGIEEGGPV